MTTERRRGSFASDSLQGPATNELDAMKRSFEERIQQLLADNGDGADLLSMSMRAATLGAGKRMRPLLLMLVARDLGCASPALIDVACAVELVHAASLILDDLPCMDDASLRRGKPAIHIQFGEDVAILASVALLSRAFGMLSQIPGYPAGHARAASSRAGADGRRPGPGARPVRRPARRRPLARSDCHHQ